MNDASRPARPMFQLRLIPSTVLLATAIGCVSPSVAPKPANLAAGGDLDRTRLLECLGAPPDAIYEPERLAGPPTPGLSVQTFDQVGSRCGTVTRRYVCYAPPALGPQTTAPVLIVLHGQGASAEAMMNFQARSTFNRLADHEGFVVVYGNGLPAASNIHGVVNSGRWRSDDTDVATAVDDVGYLDRVVSDLVARSVIAGGNDVYLVGQSNGGGMALTAARQRPGDYAGVAAFMPFVGFSPSAPESLVGTRLRRVMFAYSFADPGLPPDYTANVLVPLARRWAHALGLSASEDTAVATTVGDVVTEGEGQAIDADAVRATRASTVRRLDWRTATRAFRELVFDRAGHFWPTHQYTDPEHVLRKFGLRNQDIEGADETWSFFRQ